MADNNSWKDDKKWLTVFCFGSNEDKKKKGGAEEENKAFIRHFYGSPTRELIEKTIGGAEILETNKGFWDLNRPKNLITEWQRILREKWNIEELRLAIAKEISRLRIEENKEGGTGEMKMR